MTRYISDGTVQETSRCGDIAIVVQGEGYSEPGKVSCSVENTGNGYIARFNAPNCTMQDYYVCLDYAQARDLVLGLAEFKKELGFK